MAHLDARKSNMNVLGPYYMYVDFKCYVIRMIGTLCGGASYQSESLMVGLAADREAREILPAFGEGGGGGGLDGIEILRPQNLRIQTTQPKC